MEKAISQDKIQFLQNMSLALRIDSLRAITAANSGHATSCLSAADIVSTIFFNFLRYDLKNPAHPNNDRFILSKGHAIPIVYAAWKHFGVISDDELLTLRNFDSPLEGHPTPRFPYNEAATGSLGQGLGIGVGMALNAHRSTLDYITYVMMGDAESAEGSVWEAAEFAGHYKMSRLIGIIDCNRLGQSGSSLDNHAIETYEKKWQAFGWKTYSIDGHNIEQIVTTLTNALQVHNQPVMIIAKTVKGYGIDDIADKNGYHGKPFSKDELESRVTQLKKKFATSTPVNTVSYQPPSPSHTPEHQAITPTLSLESDVASKEFDRYAKIATRKAYGHALAALGKIRKEVFALDADVKNSTYSEIFEKEFPERFIQCFIAEQNMLSIATGLQSRGKIPFAATFACFFSRAFDQIRMAGIGRNALRLCGSHAGVSIGEDGPSQMGLEDIALMRTVPDSIVLYPSDGVSTYKLVGLMASYDDGVSYLRTTRAATPNLYDKKEQFAIGGCKVLRQNQDEDYNICIIAAGITVHEALKAADLLAQEEIEAVIIDLYSIKPFDVDTVRKIGVQANKMILTVEDHYLEGGIGEMIGSTLANEGFFITSLTVPDIPRSGTPADNLSWAGIDANNIVKSIKKLLRET